jgi:sugar/nucleoside kinase (ribokinase family)
VTIDCPPGGRIHRAASVTIVSGEYRRNHHPGAPARTLIRRYADSGPGLIVFTQGSGPILFCRGSGPVLSERPVATRILSTLGAGDTFRAGVMQGMLLRHSDREIVRFAAATSAAVCSRFPFALDPPGIAEIQALRRRTK